MQKGILIQGVKINFAICVKYYIKNLKIKIGYGLKKNIHMRFGLNFISCNNASLPYFKYGYLPGRASLLWRRNISMHAFPCFSHDMHATLSRN